nr:MAG TPA: minor capsid component [Caudoviricetes sp.]
MILLQNGFDLPEIKERNLKGRKKGTGNLGEYHPDSKIIYINNHPIIKEMGGLRKIMQNEVVKGRAVQDNVVLHELAHYIDQIINPGFDSPQHSYRVFLNREYVKEQLSEYAYTNRSEFEAELISGILRGKVYPKEILDYADISKLDNEKAKHILALGNGTIPNDSGLPREFDKMAETVYKNPEKDAAVLLTDSDVRKFIERQKLIFDNAVDTALKEVPLDDISVQRLKESNYVFSGIKTFHELNETFPSLLDEEGNRKPFNQFLNDVQKVYDAYNVQYLRTEYNFAQASALMAARWKKFEQDGDRYNLQYRTMYDKRVRRTHRMLHNITLPIESPFWNKYFPPNGWNCRCTVVQVRKEKYPLSDEQEAMNLGSQATAGKYQEMFMFNPGKRMTTFPAYNGYTLRKCNRCEVRPDKMKLAADIPDNEVCRACRLLQESISHYTVVPTKAGKLRIHDGHGKHECEENIRIGTYLAEKHGYEIDLLDNPQGRKSADSYNRTLDMEQEYKMASTPSVNAIDRLIRDGRKQADNIVLWLDTDIPLGNLRDAITSRIRRADNVQSLTIIRNGKDVTYNREDILKNNWEIKQADFK